MIIQFYYLDIQRTCKRWRKITLSRGTSQTSILV